MSIDRDARRGAFKGSGTGRAAGVVVLMSIGAVIALLGSWLLPSIAPAGAVLGLGDSVVVTNTSANPVPTKSVDTTTALFAGTVQGSGLVPSPAVDVSAMRSVRVHVACYLGCVGAGAYITVIGDVAKTTGSGNVNVVRDLGGTVNGNELFFDRVYEVPGATQFFVQVVGTCNTANCVAATVAIVGRTN